jgi:hypothetical protein
MKQLGFLVFLIAAEAAAQGKPTVVDYPLDVRMSSGGDVLKELQDDFRRMLARNSGIFVPTRSEWKSAVTALKREDCRTRNECLQQLATTAGTLYALYASVEMNAAGTDLLATGRVVNQDGVQVRPPVEVMLPKGSKNLSDASHDALSQLVEKLVLEQLPPVLTPKPIADAPRVDDPVRPVGGDPVVPVVIVQTTSTGRLTSYVVGGVGLIGIAVGSAMLVSAQLDTGKLNTTPTGIVVGRPNDESAAVIESVMTKRTVGTAVLALGSAAFVTGAVMFFLSPAVDKGSETPVITFAPGRDGAMVQAQWRLP